MLLLQLLAVSTLSTPAAAPVGPRLEPIAFTRPTVAVADTPTVTDTVRHKRARPRAIEYSDAYYTRLRIHQVASYAELPMFAAEWYLGQKILNEEKTGFASDGLKLGHNVVAVGLGALFTVNTITGGWNLWESRSDPAGRTLRVIHSLAMLGADAGFAWAGASGGGAKETDQGASHHRTIALASIGLATAGTVMMWLFHD